MSVHAISWVFKYSQSKGTDRLVMLVLADHAGQDGWVSYPSISRIAQFANASESAIHRSLRSLVGLGELEITKQGSFDARIRADKKPNLYVIKAGDYPQDGVSPATPGDRNGVSLTNERGVKNRPRGVSPVAPKPSLEPSLNRGTSYPHDGLARFPQPRPFCESCEGTTKRKDADGNFTRETCSECPEVTDAG